MMVGCRQLVDLVVRRAVARFLFTAIKFTKQFESKSNLQVPRNEIVPIILKGCVV